MKTLLFGGYGLLGSDIYHSFSEKGIDIIRFSKQDINLLDYSALESCIAKHKPDLVINAAGYTNVAGAETDAQAAYENNCVLTYHLIQVLREYKCNLVAFSSDYVFDGKTQTLYSETDIPFPINTYGWSKFISEELIRSHYPNHYIIRTSWLFGQNGYSFPKAILSKLKNDEDVDVVCDQYGSPTYTKDISQRLTSISKLPYGTYHLTNNGVTSWYQFAREIAKLAEMDENKIQPIPSATLDKTIRRPAFSGLNNGKWESYTEGLRHYSEALREFVQLIKKNGEI